MKTYLLGAVGLGALASLYALTRKKVISAASSSVALSEQSNAEPTPQERAIFQEAAATMRQACEQELKRAPSSAELLYCLAVAKLETSFGRGWKGAMQGSNNWGAVQCTKAQAEAGQGCAPWEDSYPDGTKYKQAFRTYASPVDGARDVVKHVLTNRKSVGEALQGSEATIFRASLAMRRTTYYGGFCPKTKARFGTVGSYSAQRNPSTEPEKSCEVEAVTMHAKTVVDPLISKLSKALDLPRLPLGSFEEALEWYLGREGSKAVAGQERDTRSALDWHDEDEKLRRWEGWF